MALTQVKSDGIADGAVTTNDLSDSGVTAGTYGSSSAIPAITVDAKGRVTSASTNSVTQVGGANGVDFNDNVKARFGTGNDLEIYHDGSHSYVKDAGTGSLYIQSDDIRFINSAGNENLTILTENGAATLHYDNSAKLATTSTGINVTGTVTSDGVTSEGIIIAQGNAEFQVRVKDGNSTGSAAETGIQFVDSANTQQAQIGCISSGNLDLYIGTQTNGSITFQTNGTNRLFIANDGASVYPAATNNTDIGTPSNQFRNAYFDGTVNCDGLSVEGAGTFTGNITTNGQILVGNGQTSSYITMFDSDNGSRAIHSNSNYIGFLTQSGAWGARCDDNGHWHPGANNTHDLGSNSLRWRNVYTNDLNLSNEGGTNDVDGTWGSWTIQEGEDDLFLLNRRNGKKYKFALTEVN